MLRNKVPLRWEQQQALQSRGFTCGHCGTPVASERGWTTNDSSASIYICHACTRPVFIDRDGEQVPGPVFGNAVQGISDKSVEAIYEEARNATGANAYTATVLCCRKLLMHIAVAKGAPTGQNFVAYVEYLSAKGYVPPDAKDWVDHIRKAGNEANHEIKLAKKDEAEELLSFCEMLLKIIYEFPAAAKKRYAAGAPGP